MDSFSFPQNTGLQDFFYQTLFQSYKSCTCTRKMKFFLSKINCILGQIKRSLTRAKIGITIRFSSCFLLDKKSEEKELGKRARKSMRKGMKKEEGIHDFRVQLIRLKNMESQSYKGFEVGLGNDFILRIRFP